MTGAEEPIASNTISLILVNRTTNSPSFASVVASRVTKSAAILAATWVTIAVSLSIVFSCVVRLTDVSAFAYRPPRTPAL